MMQLLHATGVRLGLVTNGEHWMLVNAPKGETTGYASWYATLWLEEPITLRAFRTLLGADRFFGVPDDETLEALLDQSAADQQEVTDQLGYQVRKAVEVLIQALDRADQDHGRKLLAEVHETVLYESALTVMMRLVFLFCAEERELLLLGDAALRPELRRLHAAGATCESRPTSTAKKSSSCGTTPGPGCWPRSGPSTAGSSTTAQAPGLRRQPVQPRPLPVPRRPQARHVLAGHRGHAAAGQQPHGAAPARSAASAASAAAGRRTSRGRRLSFRALDIEQIGHVYEGLLDHTAKRATEPLLGLAGTRDKEPEIALAELEKIAAKGEKELLKFLKEETGRSESRSRRR